jgi:chromosome segregation ATPase
LSLKHAESELENEKVNSNALNDQIKKHQEEINEANEAQMKHLVLLQKKQHECDKLIETQKSVISEYGLKESIFKFEKGELLTRLKNVKDKLAAKEDELNDVMVKTKEEATKFRQKINSQEVLLEELQKAKEKFTITSHNYSVELQKKKEQITVAKDGLNFAKRKVKELGEYLDGFDADSKRRKSL